MVYYIYLTAKNKKGIEADYSLITYDKEIIDEEIKRFLNKRKLTLTKPPVIKDDFDLLEDLIIEIAKK